MGQKINGTALIVRKLKKQFGSKVVLHEVDLDAAPGEFIVVIGKSGSGKTTLLRQIAGLDTPNSGEIWLDGDMLDGHNHAARVMFQDARLLPWKTVLQNVGLGLTGDWQPRAERALRQVGLSDRFHDWPSILSGGQRQRVALARALASQPPLLLLDEPLGALDALTRIEMQRLIEHLWLEQRFTALLITHDVEEAVALADRVILIEDGRIALNVTIDLPRPRQRGSADFASLKDRILGRVLGETESFEAASVGVPIASPAHRPETQPIPAFGC